MNSTRDTFLIFVVHSKSMGEDEENIIIKAEKEEREIGIADQNPHNRKKEKKEIPLFAPENHMKNVNKNAGLDENDNYIHRRQLNQPKQRKIRKNKYH
ncbi:MAG: hypothetical protein QOK88_09355 [Nitrososphaeraceae archaeon]|nr:hypothetical protein [Nitrososphaeraceae archaeon]